MGRHLLAPAAERRGKSLPGIVFSAYSPPAGGLLDRAAKVWNTDTNQLQLKTVFFLFLKYILKLFNLSKLPRQMICSTNCKKQ